MRYRLVTLDVTEDNEINDAYSTDTVLDLSDNPTAAEVAKALKDVGRMADDFPPQKVRLEEDGDDYLVCNHHGRKAYLLRRDP